MDSRTHVRRIRFGDFDVDLRTAELLKGGRSVRIQEKPFQVLAMLLERPGDLVTREELRQALWPADTFVDFDVGLNTAIRKLRDALGDSADEPRFIETLPRRGYRFVATVESEPPPDAVDGSAPDRTGTSPVQPEPADRPIAPKVARVKGSRRVALALGSVAGVLVVAGALIRFTGAWNRVGHPSLRIRSIAVLPLDDLSGDPSQAYFTDGMTDALITDLAKIGSLRVISRTSSMHYRGPNRRLPEIARDLNVDSIVEGSVLRAGNRVRITAQLIHVPTDQHLWANSYERDLKDVLALQGEVAGDIAQQIEAKLTPEEQVRVAKVSRCTPPAHDLVLQGLYHWFKATPDDYERSREYAEQAVALDPGCARAHEVLAYYYGITADEGLRPPKEAWNQVREHSRKALELDETLSSAHVALGTSNLYFDWKWSEAEKELRRGVELNPSDSEAHREYSVCLRTMARMDEAIAEARQAQEVDPLSVSISASLGWAYYYARRWDAAIAQFQKTVGMDANFIAAHEGLARCYEQKGMYREAVEAFASELELVQAKDTAESLRGDYQRVGYRAAMRNLYHLKLDEFQEMVRHDYVTPLLFADVYALLNDREQAFTWLEKAYEERSSKLVDLKSDPDFDSLRTDPRFADLVRRIGLP
jgi:TolB-like protein/DNA-binding winged helix-turn-helix (wHTH) protein/Tfp pilus assembly protein PilF